ncbi:MAG TPA: hypothetical protein VLW53_12935 [Candidatus Eisenbacteria bacterium]|nr:hypothetical protein [Candidatus Eisenbacteria bacterium]
MWVLLFLLDGEKRPRRSVVAGLLAVVLTVARHLWLSGPWMEQAGLGLGQRPASAPAPASTRSPFDVLGAAQDALARLASDTRVHTGP